MFNFLTEEHRQIAESARKIFEDLGAADTVERQTAKKRIDAAVVRSALYDLGVFGMSSEDRSMCCAQVQTIIAREAGAACLPFPALEALAAHAITMNRMGYAGNDADDVLATLSLTEADELSSCELTDGTLSGRVPLVAFAQHADVALIRVRLSNAIALAQVPLAAGSVHQAMRATVEPDYPVHDLKFDQVPVALVFDRLETGELAADALLQRTSLLAAAELAGACRRMIHMTRDYLVSRTQFGSPLGSNQALKHALDDALVRLEAMNAAIDYAAAASDAGAPDAQPSICAAKLYAGRSGKAIADAALQMHGAIGYTMDFPLHLLMRRAYRLHATHGSARVQSERIFNSFAEI